MVVCDYGQIELRIAAALALRAVEEIKKALAGEFQAPNWILKALRAETEPTFEMAARLWKAWQAVQRVGLPMLEAFRRGVDPHLLTGLKMAAAKIDPDERTQCRRVVHGLLAGHISQVEPVLEQ